MKHWLKQYASACRYHPYQLRRIGRFTAQSWHIDTLHPLNVATLVKHGSMYLQPGWHPPLLPDVCICKVQMTTLPCSARADDTIACFFYINNRQLHLCMNKADSESNVVRIAAASRIPHWLLQHLTSPLSLLCF